MEIIAGRPSGTDATAGLISEQQLAHWDLAEHRAEDKQRRHHRQNNGEDSLAQLVHLYQQRRAVFSIPSIIWLMWPSSVSCPVAITTPIPTRTHGGARRPVSAIAQRQFTVQRVGVFIYHR